MDGLFYNEALDGVLNHQHHHHHQHQHHHQQHHHHHDHNHPPPPPPPPPPHSHHGEAGGSGFESLSRNLSLNLADAPDALTLTSPDLQLLKLSSPELERLIIQSCNGLAPSTPSTGPARAFPAAKPEAGEHDAFDALHEFQHRMAGHPDTDDVATGPSHVSSTNFAEHLNHTWGDAMYTDVPPCALPAAPPLHPPPPPPHHPPHQQFGCAPALKDESQKVPETPPLSPIDMEDQERIKAERKRMRNRVAASKCRKRKLERLARLEERVSRLTGENGELRSSAETLRDQVTQLRHQLLDHIKSGCKLLSQQLQTVKEF